jgi:hypothetical protein
MKTIPPLDSLSPRLAMLRIKREEKHEEIPPLKARCAEIRARLRSGGLPDLGNENENRVRAILGEEPLPSKLPDVDDLTQTLTKLDIVNSAISVIDRAILIEAQSASNKMYDSVKPEVMRLGQGLAKAYVDLHSAHLAFDQFVNDLEDAGGNVSTLRIRPNGLSHPMDRCGAYFYGLREFIDAGFLSKSDMPKVLQS